MESHIGSLEEGRDSRAEFAQHDKIQFLASLVIAATGMGLVGVGIKTAINFPRPDGRGIGYSKPIPIGLPNGSFIPRPYGRGILSRH